MNSICDFKLAKFKHGSYCIYSMPFLVNFAMFLMVKKNSF